MKLQQRGSRENMLDKQRLSHLQSTAEVAANEYRCAAHIKHDAEQLTQLLQVTAQQF
jgi:hypothetical protein